MPGRICSELSREERKIAARNREIGPLRSGIFRHTLFPTTSNETAGMSRADDVEAHGKLQSRRPGARQAPATKRNPPPAQAGFDFWACSSKHDGDRISAAVTPGLRRR